MLKKSLILFALGCGITAPFAVFAEPLSLQSAVAQALQNNPGLHAVKSDVAAAEARASAAGVGGKPIVTANYAVQGTNNPLDAFAHKLYSRDIKETDFAADQLNDPDFGYLHSFGISLKMPIYTGGKLQAEIQGAKNAATASDYQYQRARVVTALRTTQAYLAAQAAKRGIEIAKQGVDAAQKHANTTRNLYNEGRIVESDKLTADVNLAAYRAGLSKARGQYRQATNQLALAMGKPGTELDVTHDIPVNATAPEAAPLIQTATEMRKDLKAVQAQLDATRNQVDAAKSAKKPRVSLIASNYWYNQDQPAFDNDAQSVMGVVEMDLYNAPVNDQVTAASMNVNSVEAKLQELRQQIATDVYNALAQMEASRSRYQIASASVNTAKRAVHEVNQRYGEGRTILIDLLQAERSLVETRQEQLNALHDLAEGQAVLEAATGTLALPSGAE